MTEPTRHAVILALGDELVLGQTVDTNSAWIAARLTERGVHVREHLTLPDDFDTLADAFERLVGTVDLIVTTGGLGPTADDLTRDVLAEIAGEDLVVDQTALEQIRAYFTDRGREMPQRNEVQGQRPRSARCLRNDNGTAPGLVTHIGAEDAPGGTDVLCLPGPPRELVPIFEREIGSVLRPDPERTVAARAIPTFGLGESALADRLGELMSRDRNPLIGTTASQGVVTCRVRYEGSPADAESALDEAERAIRERLGLVVLRVGAGPEPLGDVVGGLLRECRQTACTVESCTGGLLGAMITSLPGSSDYYVGGAVTYADALKSRVVGVPEDLLRTHGAVSAPVADAMARGGLSTTGADHALAITGVAGPGGGSPDKPVGTVWIALATRGQARPDVRRFLFAGDRESVRVWAARSALGMLRLRLLGEDMPLLGEVARA